MLLPAGCNTLQDRSPWEIDLGLIEELGLVRLSALLCFAQTMTFFSSKCFALLFLQVIALLFSIVFAGLKDAVLCFAQ
ncbi:hypothetical protein HYC85_020746 [Camellia sinensis]|uniref:Uncharacterized protein n=1 Tax=Camellia sinensis TaxID=4442 RepID=A0A7J7GUI1_CAMSI|nr:hypothetical protein HYC85_020746 [Camellia sinensis]